MTVAISGARGFVGQHLLPLLERRGFATLALTRERSTAHANEVLCDLDHSDEPKLPRITAFIHLAARVHVMNDQDEGSRSAYFRTNVDGTLKMLRAAHRAQAERFVFLSSIKVLGEETVPARPFPQSADPSPEGPYAKSKLAAEGLVRQFCADHSMEWLIIRPVLIYGPGVGANFRRLVTLISRGWPLPFAAINNRRSVLSVKNLCDFIAFALSNQSLGNRTINLADPVPLSTPNLIQCVAAGLGRKATLIPVPTRLLEALGAIFGREPAVRRLTRSLEISTSDIYMEMGWVPPFSTEEALHEAAADVRQSF